jgi:hypothetical protein
MREALPKLDLKKLEEPEFSHGETLQITGLTADTLLTWHKRGVVPNIGDRDQGGRGHRRKYSAMHLAYLMVLKQLSGKMPLLVAGMAAANAVPLILGTFMMLRYTENADEIEAMPSLVLVAYEDDAGQTKLELFTSKEKQGIPTIPPCGIEQWMRALNIQSATILNIVSLTLMLFWNIGDVKEKRSPRKSSK